MHKGTVVYPYNGILLHDKKERTTDICNNTAESPWHDAKGRKHDTKAHNSIDRTLWKRQNYRN